MYSKLFDSTYCEIETANSWSHKKKKKKEKKKQDHLGLAIRALIRWEKISLNLKKNRVNYNSPVQAENIYLLPVHVSAVLNAPAYTTLFLSYYLREVSWSSPF